MEGQLGTEERPLRVAVIGAGPAGYYTAEALLKQDDLHCTVDLFNRYPTPFGLVREGVAPDHQSIKAVVRIFDRVSRDPRVRFFGNVTFGEDLRLEDLDPLYDQIVYAVGAQSDRKMGIEGERLPGSWPATEFVRWYNGHPDGQRYSFDLSHERVVVVGNGNVAIDVARILLLSPDVLATTDIADHALAYLRESSVREVVMLGRRGPAQAAFTATELREFGQLEGIDVVVDPADLELDELSAAAAEEDRRVAKNLEILQDYAERPLTGAPRRIVFRFLTSPVEIVGTERVEGVRIERNRLVPRDGGGSRPEGTGTFETIDAGMVLRSIGYRGIPLPDVPFDPDRAVVRNEDGRVVEESGRVAAGQYVVGWCKRGPSGIIGTNKADAKGTVSVMLEDLPSISPVSDELRSTDAVVELLESRDIGYVTYEDWLVLDAHECGQGEREGRPRVKLCTVEEMLEVIRAARAAG